MRKAGVGGPRWAKRAHPDTELHTQGPVPGRSHLAHLTSGIKSEKNPPRETGSGSQGQAVTKRVWGPHPGALETPSSGMLGGAGAGEEILSLAPSLTHAMHRPLWSSDQVPGVC